MYEHNGEEIFVIDSHVHLWDASKENVKHEGGGQFIQRFYEYHTGFTPEDEQWSMEEYRQYDPERMRRTSSATRPWTWGSSSRRTSTSSTTTGSTRSTTTPNSPSSTRSGSSSTSVRPP